jgi:hypothetical protein
VVAHLNTLGQGRVRWVSRSLRATGSVRRGLFATLRALRQRDRGRLELDAIEEVRKETVLVDRIDTVGDRVVAL